MKRTWRHWLYATMARARGRGGQRGVLPSLEILEDRNLLSGVSPFVQSINRPANAPYITTAPSVSFTVVFNEDVTGVDAGDFALAPTGTVAASPTLQVTPVSASVYA